MVQSRFIVGLILCIVAALLFIFTSRPQTVPAAITLGILGIILIAISRR